MTRARCTSTAFYADTEVIGNLLVQIADVDRLHHFPLAPRQGAATAGMWEGTKKIVTPALVAEATHFRTEYEAGKCKDEQQKYVESFKKITVALDGVMSNFK
jgi:hypothetical protein